MKYWASCCLLCFFFNSCVDGISFRKNAKDPLLVKVGNKSLFTSEVSNLVHDGISPSDSIAIVDGYIQNWIRENLMVVEAEKNIAADINLNKLVDDYRSSLLVYNFEKKLIEQQLDTVVPISERLKYYEDNKQQFLLSHPITKCIVAKISQKVNVKNLKEMLLRKDESAAIFSIKEKAAFYQLDTMKWFVLEEIKEMVPEEMLDEVNLKRGSVHVQTINNYQYFVKFIRVYDRNEVPPFEYIDDKIIKIILNDRKTQLINNYRNNLYEEGIENKTFEYYIN